MKSNDSSKIWLVVSLLIMIACSIYLAMSSTLEHLAQTERRATYEEYAEQAQALLDQQQWIVTGAADSYRADAYVPGVKRIAEQQLIAIEYQILLLQTIVQQNAMMIELMAMMP